MLARGLIHPPARKRPRCISVVVALRIEQFPSVDVSRLAYATRQSGSSEVYRTSSDTAGRQTAADRTRLLLPGVQHALRARHLRQLRAFTCPTVIPHPLVVNL